MKLTLSDEERLFGAASSFIKRIKSISGRFQYSSLSECTLAYLTVHTLLR